MPGPPPSLTDLVARHRGELLAYLVRLLGNEDDAQDACQDALLRAHHAFARLGPGSNARAWLYRVATRCGLNVARRRARRAARGAAVDIDTLPANPGAPPEARERLRAVARAVETLPPRQRAALMLRQFHGLGYAEIAASVGGTPEAARANVYQAVKKLRASVGGTD